MGTSFLKKLLPTEDRVFYSLFHEAVSVASDVSILFHDIVFTGFNDERYEAAKRLKAQSSNIYKNLIGQINKTFVTPIDREDILEMGFLLNKITKRIVRGCVNMKVYRLNAFPDVMHQQSETLMRATAKLKIVVDQMTKSATIHQITELNREMAEIEHQGDEILYKAMDQLFSGQYGPVDIIKLRDIYHTIESALDNCFNVSNTVFNITLKNS